jgi:hypothetical protein
LIPLSALPAALIVDRTIFNDINAMMAHQAGSPSPADAGPTTQSTLAQDQALRRLGIPLRVAAEFPRGPGEAQRLSHLGAIITVDSLIRRDLLQEEAQQNHANVPNIPAP